jgi:hypothetical protein
MISWIRISLQKHKCKPHHIQLNGVSRYREHSPFFPVYGKMCLDITVNRYDCR